jgi:hypothetical protein
MIRIGDDQLMTRIPDEMKNTARRSRRFEGRVSRNRSFLEFALSGVSVFEVA